MTPLTLAWSVRRRARVVAATVLVMGIGLALPAVAGETIAQVKSRKTLRCGVSEGVLGFSLVESSGRWSGIDADFCRAVAAASLGDADKVTFVPLRASARFPALHVGSVDLLVRNTTWTLSREAGLKVVFAGILFYDAQGFMVPAAAKVTTVAQLAGATVCVEKGTTHEQNLADYFGGRNLEIKPLVIDSTIEVADAFFAGRCAAYTGDAAHLAAARQRAPAGRRFRILDERISKEPLAPAVRSGDDDWLTLVRWVLFTLITAEEEGITQARVRNAGANAAARRLAELEGESARALGAEAGWALRAIQSVGNYGEMFERNLGQSSPLQLDRGLNRLWNRGGLMYAPPLR